MAVATKLARQFKTGSAFIKAGLFLFGSNGRQTPEKRERIEPPFLTNLRAPQEIGLPEGASRPRPCERSPKKCEERGAPKTNEIFFFPEISPPEARSAGSFTRAPRTSAPPQTASTDAHRLTKKGRRVTDAISLVIGNRALLQAKRHEARATSAADQQQDRLATGIRCVRDPGFQFLDR